MRIRSTKPEFWRSDRIAAVSWNARLVLKALESFVDDNGVGKDDLELIVGDLFMRDLVREPSRTLAKVSEAISELHQGGLVWRYEAGDTNLLYISFWESVQRIDKPQSGRFRRPDGTLHYKESEIRDSVATPREDSRALAPGTGEQGNRGTGDNTPSSADADGQITEDFAAWYELYPRKVGKQGAVKAYRRARKTASADDILKGLRRQLPILSAAESRFQPHPATWLNEGRWEDEATTDADPADEGAWLGPWTPPAAPPEIADDPGQYATWLDEQRKAAGR